MLLWAVFAGVLRPLSVGKGLNFYFPFRVFCPIFVSERLPATEPAAATESLVVKNSQLLAKVASENRTSAGERKMGSRFSQVAGFGATFSQSWIFRANFLRKLLRKSKLCRGSFSRLRVPDQLLRKVASYGSTSRKSCPKKFNLSRGKIDFEFFLFFPSGKTGYEF